MYIAFVSGGFPRPRGRGPIEARLAAACCPGTPRRFLDREVEAQLKRRKDAALTVEQTWFPRPRGRGPIEASRTAGCGTPAPTRFPRPRGRGPIEATCPGRAANTLNIVSSTARSRPN